MDKIEKNNETIVLSVLYAKREETYPADVSKHNSNHEKQVILLMIPNGEGWYHLAVRKLLALLREITLKYDEYFH